MKSAALKILFLLFFLAALHFTGCQSETIANKENAKRTALINPDYTNVTIPCNIAPLNFSIKESGKAFKVTLHSQKDSEILQINSTNGNIQFSEKKWKDILHENTGTKIKITISCRSNNNNLWLEFEPFTLNISEDSIDSYLAYRIIHPGYYNWSNIKIEQRSLSDFHTESIIENQTIEKNCVNCHSFNNNNPNEFLIHIRGSLGGTYFSDNDRIVKTNLKTENMPGGATYPAWHPNGKFVAFSSNQVRQSFYAQRGKNIEVYDLISSLILYDRETIEITNITTQDTINPLQTFPTWSPDGKYLYFCRAVQDENNTERDLNNIMNIHYNLVRKPFFEGTKTFGETEIVYDAKKINKSVSFPKIAPNGKHLVFTLQDYGTFPIWHEEANLYIIDLKSKNVAELKVNSNKTESYHAWSSNGKWLVFSSKRMDGRSARPFFAHINSDGKADKPFALPQKDPLHYEKMLASYNIPELVSDKIKFSPRNFTEAASQTAIQSKSAGEDINLKIIKKENKNISEDNGIHE